MAWRSGLRTLAPVRRLLIPMPRLTIFKPILAGAQLWPRLVAVLGAAIGIGLIVKRRDPEPGLAKAAPVAAE